MEKNRIRKNLKPWLTALMLLVALNLISAATWPEEKTPLKQISDDALAEKYCPVIVQGDNIKPDVSHIYYRMAEDENRIFIAYHVAWAYEKDETKGLLAVWDKVFYTGGLKLQKTIFGPEDIEVIEFVIDKKTGNIIRIRYESAEVTKVGEKVKQNHLAKELATAKPPVYFETITWNHMFALSSADKVGAKKVFKLKPDYFTDERWSYYKMSKKHQTLLSQDRAYHNWETKTPAVK